MSLFHKPFDSNAYPTIFPTYLLPSLPFRRNSRQSSTDSANSTASTTTTASSNLSTTSSNPFSRCPTPVPVLFDDTPIQAPTDKFLSGHASHILCAKCSTDLCLTSQIISKGFTGRHGRAYLVQGAPIRPGSHVYAPTLPNTFLAKPVPRHLVTGQHMVSDVSCSLCGSLLGWKYVEASESGQKYKVGKFILETKKVRVSLRWDNPDLDDDATVGYDEVVPLSATELKKLVDAPNHPSAKYKDLEFDSQDEDECEDLFAGVWSPQLAARRRHRKKERYSRKAAGAKVFVPSRGSQDSLA